MNEIRNIPTLRFSDFTESWKKRKLKEFSTFFSGGTPTSTIKKFYNGSIPFIKSGEINSTETKQFLSEEGLNNSSAKRVSKGDLLYALYGATSGEVGISKIDGAINQAVLCIRGDFNNNLLANYLRKEKNKIVSTYLQGGQGNLSADIIKNLKLFLPSQSEQQKISDFLTAVDKRIELLEKKKTLLETYKKGVMKKIFNQEIRFKDDNGIDFPDWEEMRLGDITNKKSSNISANSIEQIEGDYIVYGATGELKKIDFYEMDRPYISIVKDGSGVGRVNMCKPFSSVLGTLDILTNNELSDLDFVFQFLSKTSFLKYVTGSSIPHIYYKDYSKLKMLVPTVEEQVKISEFLSSIDNQIELLETQIDKSKTWKKGLLQKMFV